jgi:succinate dehydrogenase assembly factor 2
MQCAVRWWRLARTGSGTATAAAAAMTASRRRALSSGYRQDDVWSPASGKGTATVAPPYEWPQPHLLPQSNSGPVESSEPQMRIRVSPIVRKNESVDVLRARLVWKSRKRGTLESDLIISSFAGKYLNVLGEVRSWPLYHKCCSLETICPPCLMHTHARCRPCSFAAILGAFTRHVQAELRDFDRLLDEMDWDIYHWATNHKEPPVEHQNRVMKLLVEHTLNNNRQALRMPSLPMVNQQTS